MVFGVGFGVAPIGEQPDNLEAICRAAAYQDCHRHLVTTVLDRLAAEGRAAVARTGVFPCNQPKTASNMVSHCFDRCDGHHKMANSPLQRTPALVIAAAASRGLGNSPRQ
jgi:hypothetical protein